MADEPNFAEYSWLELVLRLEPDYYEWPVVYEFQEGKRKFRKNDADWYAAFTS